MSDQDHDRVEKGWKNNSFLFQAIQQQFECMNVMFGETKDWLELQDVAIANLQWVQSPQVKNTRRQQR